MTVSLSCDFRSFHLQLISLEIVSYLPDCFHWILRNDPVMCDENKLLLLCLRNKKSVERITMHFRQIAYAVKMRGKNRQRVEPCLAANAIVFGHGDVAIQSSEALLNRDFPKRCNGVVTFRCVHQITHRQRKFLRGIFGMFLPRPRRIVASGPESSAGESGG